MDYSKLNKHQYDAVMNINGPLLILAGAGTGKTCTLTYRLAHLLEEGVNPENILLLTFTNKAADEMASRAKSMLGESYDISKLMACTYHSFALNMLKIYGTKKFTIADTATSKDIIKLVKEENGIDNTFSSSFYMSLFSLSANLQEDLEDIILDRYNNLCSSFDIFEDVYNGYEEYKKEKKLYDYDDLLVNFLELLDNNPSLCTHLSNKYQYIMVDEYQDSNKLQFEILCKLCRTHTNLCVVGDDSQSIYSWRGANHKNILNFPKQFPGCKKVILDVNYRSGQPILDLANELVQIMAEKYDKTLVSGKKGRVPILYKTNTGDASYNLCLQIIKNKIEDGVPLSEICVLARNSASLNVLEFSLKKDGIPYRKYGGLKFLEKAHVRDVLAFMRIVTNINDELAWLRVLVLIPNLGFKTASKIFKEVTIDGFEGLTNKKFMKRKYSEDLLELYRFLFKLMSEDLTTQITDIIAYLTPIYKNNKIYKDNWTTRIEELSLFFDVTSKYSSTEKFLDDIVLNGVEEDSSDEEKLTLSTIHSAKGLEFHTVCLLDCIEGTIPSKRDGKYENLEEDKRLLYVAITRAKESLYLFFPQISIQYGKTVYNKISSFLKEGTIYSKFEKREV